MGGMKDKNFNKKLFRDWINDSCTHSCSETCTFALNQGIWGNYT